MKIWVDADACPGVIRDILFRAANRPGTMLTVVADQAVNVPAAIHLDRFLTRER